MFELKKCCCGLMPLREGCITIASTSIVLCPATWGYLLSMWYGAVPYLAVALVLELLVWIVLWFGAFLNNCKLLLTTIIGLITVIVIRIGVFIGIWIYLAGKTDNDGYAVDEGLTFLKSLFLMVVVPLYLYWVIVIQSFYRTLKQEGSDAS